MKKLFLCAALAVFAFTSVNAQEVTFGVKAGVNLASIAGDDTDGVSSLTSFHIGGVAEISFSDKFSFQPELLYSAQGYSYDSFDVKLDYINIPLLAKYYVAEGFSIEAGPQVGFLMSAKAEDEDVKDFVSGIDFGLGIGVGYKMDSGLNFAARYNLGLSNINDGEGSDDFKNQNNVIQLSVGYMF